MTIPAGDFEIVLGKYLAAVAIFTVALLFSLACNLAVLEWLGNPDVGLFLGTYAGYWLVGLAMLSIGMVASFLTGNTTIGFVLGVVFNAPLVFLATVNSTILGGLKPRYVQDINDWSIGSRMYDFTHGVLSLSGAVYFLAIVCVMLYLSMVLIGRRHWYSGLRRWAMGGHFLVRTFSLTVVAVGAVFLFQHHDLRLDVTSEQLSSLSPQTRGLIRDLKATRPVQIEAFISPDVPESYVQTRKNLLAALRELRSVGGDKLQVEIHDTDNFSREAALAEDRFGIEPHQVSTRINGVEKTDSIFLNVAVKCGTSEPLLTFFDRGVSTEYELVRSICTAAQEKRKKVGVLETDAKLFGGFNMQTMSADPDWLIVDELKKQYEVVRVDPTKPLTERYDALLAVQASSLGPQEMQNFIAAVRAGQPAAIFEDPAPIFCPWVPATSAPRMPPGGMNAMFMQQRPLPKGDIRPLWELLGVDFPADQIVWQTYNPYPKFSQFPTEFVFIDNGCGNPYPFNSNDPISAGLQHVLFPFPGYVSKLSSSTFDFTKLVRTGDETGTVLFRELMQMTPMGPRGGLNPDREKIPTGATYTEAAHIKGKIALDPPADETDEKAAGAKAGKAKPREVKIDVVLVPDIDMLSSEFFRLREMGYVPEADVHFDFDNVTFVLNALDELTGDRRFIDIRKRRPAHRPLVRIEERTKEARKNAAEARDRFDKQYKKLVDQEDQEIQDRLEEMKKRKNMDLQQMAIELDMMQKTLQRKKDAKLEQYRSERDRKIKKSETELNLEVKRVQDQYKLWAVLLPPILPLFLAGLVFLIRRSREREGVARSRLK